MLSDVNLLTTTLLATFVLCASGCQVTPMTEDQEEGKPFPVNTTQSGGVTAMTLAYIDSRSLAKPGQPGFKWNSYFTAEKFQQLISFPAKGQVGPVFDQPSVTLFDAVLITGYDWIDNKKFWPGIAGTNPMNKTDWNMIWKLWRHQGLDQLEIAARSVKMTTNPQQKPTKVFITAPTPDRRSEHFCATCGPNGTALNFSIAADRLFAQKAWVDEVSAHFEQRLYSHIELVGFYWFQEEIQPYDYSLVQGLAQHIHTKPRFGPGPNKNQMNETLRFMWIPYYDAYTIHGLLDWRNLGFDFIVVQPNFQNTNSTTERFAVINSLIRNLTAGVEMELPLSIRNSIIHKNATESFYDYLHAAEKYSWICAIKAYYFANSFLEMFYWARRGNTDDIAMSNALFAQVNVSRRCHGEGNPRKRVA